MQLNGYNGYTDLLSTYYFAELQALKNQGENFIIVHNAPFQYQINKDNEVITDLQLYNHSRKHFLLHWLTDPWAIFRRFKIIAQFTLSLLKVSRHLFRFAVGFSGHEFLAA